MILCDGLVDLRLGSWVDVLADVESCDAVICDPPYSRHVHDGGAERFDRVGLGYECLSPSECHRLVRRCAGICCGWMVFHTDDYLAGVFRRAARNAGRFVFAHVPVLQHAPRLGGDGPGSPGHSLAVSRPREKRFLSWGSLPGWYETTRERGAAVLGAKPLLLMRAIVRDYTQPGDLVIDPFCGGGTTALACAMEGRRCITSEIDPKTYELARRRLEGGYQPDMFGAAPSTGDA